MLYHCDDDAPPPPPPELLLPGSQDGIVRAVVNVSSRYFVFLFVSDRRPAVIVWGLKWKWYSVASVQRVIFWWYCSLRGCKCNSRLDYTLLSRDVPASKRRTAQSIFSARLLRRLGNRRRATRHGNKVISLQCIAG